MQRHLGYFTLTVFMATSMLGLSACQQKTEAPVGSPVQGADIPTLKVTVRKADYTLVNCQGDGCPDIKITQLSTNQAWLTQFLQQRVLDASSMGPERATTKRTLQDNVNAFVHESQVDAKERGRPLSYSMDIDSQFLGQKGRLAQFQISSSSYSGGAHGISVSSYYIFDLKYKKQLKLADILLPGQQSKLHTLVYDQFKAWVEANDATLDMAEYEKTWPFHLTDNFMLDKDGLQLQYQQYEIGPYVVGMPDFSVPYAALKGLVKPEYLK